MIKNFNKHWVSANVSVQVCYTKEGKPYMRYDLKGDYRYNCGTHFASPIDFDFLYDRGYNVASICFVDKYNTLAVTFYIKGSKTRQKSTVNRLAFAIFAVKTGCAESIEEVLHSRDFQFRIYPTGEYNENVIIRINDNSSPKMQKVADYLQFLSKYPNLEIKDKRNSGIKYLVPFEL